MIKTLKEIWNNLETKEKQYLKAGLNLLLLIGFIAIVLLPWAFTRTFWSFVDYNKTGAIGDTINGIAGPFIALIAAILTFIAFYIQYKANIQQREQFSLTLEKQENEYKEQQKIWHVERFENKYFELVRMHRENVAEIGIGQDSGKKIFVIMIREFRCILKIAKEVTVVQKQIFSQEQLFIISYYAFFFGVGPNSSRMLIQALSGYDSNFVVAFEKALNNKETKQKVKSQRGFRFTPFEGHQSRLGHYFRHLYQAVCYVDNQKMDLDKKEYVKTIRAQLTTHEQALLFINCLTPIGRVWWDKELITTYKMVKNIPYGFFDKETEIDLESYFSSSYFEYQKRDITSKTQPT